MKKTWIELLHELPVDAALREFVTHHGLHMPDDFAWTDEPPTTQALIEAIASRSTAAGSRSSARHHRSRNRWPPIRPRR
ncbi:MAG: hypothetical protein MO847_11795 [Candidatus Protistobacter heckmanni]|nr:hypothetical protein [Candidatus Protistobacter heckmanni]